METDDRPASPGPTPADPAPSSDADPAAAVATLVRQTIEFLVVLALTIMICRGFAAEAYIVPTGSMAPTLLGAHREVTCRNCRFPFILGIDESGRTGRAVCPNCGQAEPDASVGVASSGDRLLVQKNVFDIRGPRRWEVAVFQSRAEPGQAYVKRVVGLPGEAVQVRGGDVFIDGQVARKDLTEFRAIRQVVFDNDYRPADADRFPRWVFRRGRYRGHPSGWDSKGSGFAHEATPIDGDLVDWLDYRHWDPESGRYGPVRDYASYNGGEFRGENLVTDLMLDFRVAARPDARNLVLRLNPGADTTFVTLPIDNRSRPEARRNGKLLAIEEPHGAILSSPSTAPRSYRVEVGVVDRRLLVAIDGVLAFAPITLDGIPGGGPGPFATPVSIGVQGGGIEVDRVRLYRDVYYTGGLAGTLKRPFGVDTPYVLGDREYFVLGDNSAVSNDSRFWPISPVVGRDDFLGKPFLVHMPGQLWPLRVFGRAVCWIPDPREIRYIR